KATLIAGLLLVVPWGIFVAALTRPGARRLSRRVWLGLGCGTAITAASAAVAGWLTAFQVADFAGAFYAARVESVGRIAILVQLLATVALLAGLEECCALRSVRHAGASSTSCSAWAACCSSASTSSARPRSST